MAGYTYNDLKLDSILFDYGVEPNLAKSKELNGLNVHLVSYGFT
jgi:hypothetical protein